MILFKPEHVLPVYKRTKTETRRMWEKPRAKVGSLHKAKTQMLSKDYFAVLKILAVYQERLSDISEESARREGGYTKEGYLDKFFAINHKLAKATNRDASLIVPWVVVFERVGDGNLPPEHFTGAKL